MAIDKSIFSDKSKLPDEAKVTLNGVDFTIGELRQLNADTEGELAKQAQALNAREEQLKKAEANAVALFLKSQELEAAKTTEPPQRTVAAGAYDPETDPYLSPLAKRLAAIEKDSLTKIAAENKQLRDAFIGLTQTLINERMYTAYDSIPAEARKEYKLEDLAKKAQELRLLDRTGAPDVRAAFDKLDEPKRIERIRAEAKEEAYKAAKEEALIASIQPPQTSLTTSRPSNGGMSLDKAMEAASKDPEIARLMHQGL